MRILTEPKNALVKQYQALLALEDVDLKFTDDALKAMAHLAIERETGARGLRSIVEEVMRDVMFDIPSREEVTGVVITEGAVLRQEEPKLVTE